MEGAQDSDAAKSAILIIIMPGGGSVVGARELQLGRYTGWRRTHVVTPYKIL
jgi:hypothetical protein